MNTEDKYNLNRFLQAQELMYPIALKELQAGHKRSHWIWYIFPQLKHLGYSHNSKYYGISGIDEATAYLSHPILGHRLREVSETILNLPSDDATGIFSHIDAVKLRSSITLFDRVSPDDVFARVLDKYFNGKKDTRTIKIISTSTESHNFLCETIQ